jgi:hypothetical protein
MKKSIILQNILPPSIFDELSEELYSNWTLDNQSYDNGKLSWGKTLDQEDSLLILEAASIIRLKILKYIRKRIKLCKIQVNGLTSGQICEMHKDYNSDSYYTFVFFTHFHWDDSWGGEFVCKNPYTDQLEYSMCTPNSGCLIPSNWYHYGKSPNMLTDNLRISIGYSYVTY